MPGLILFNRRWAISSDDFVFSSFGEAVLRISWLTVLIVIFAVHHDDFDCSFGQGLKSFYIGTVVLNSIGIIVVLSLLCISMQGTIKNSYPRRHISFCLYAEVFLLIPECVWVCLSTYWVFGHSYTCDWTVVWTARGAVFCSWAVGLSMFVGFLVVFDPVGSAKYRHSIDCHVSKDGEEQLVIGSSPTSKVWEARCRLMCCCIACNQDTRPAFVEVAKVVAEFFKDLDLVPTDIAAGLVLVQKQQLDADSQLTTIVINDGPDSVEPTEADFSGALVQPKSWMTITNMAHYMKFAMGSYGWPFYMYQNLSTGMCRLCSQCRCCSCLRKANNIFRDNICQCNTAAIKKLSGISDEDLIYVTFHNKFKQIPFYVVLDKEKNTVVISIRGTLSLQDALADISAEGVSLDIPGVESSYCHAAMLDCAKYILSELESLRLLETAFSHMQEGAGLVITGHSLGAGVAAILAVLLRPTYPQLICFSFSPPGGLMSPSASRYTQDFVCAVVVGKDLVPRLGMSTLIDLKVKILRALCESNDPKYKILASGCLRLLCCSGPSQDVPADRAPIHRSMSRYTEERVSVLQDALRIAESQSEEVVRTQWPLHPAGQILHVMELNEDSHMCGQEPQYCAMWARPEVFSRIVISHKMVSDHIPNTVGQALDQLASKHYVPQAKVMGRNLLPC